MALNTFQFIIFPLPVIPPWRIKVFIPACAQLRIEVAASGKVPRSAALRPEDAESQLSQLVRSSAIHLYYIQDHKKDDPSKPFG
jgi:hypothetical protein